MPSSDTSPRGIQSLLRGLRLRCPECGIGCLYDGFSDKRACDACGLQYFSSTGEFTGALMAAQGLYGVLTVVGFIVLYLNGIRSWPLFAWVVLAAAVVPVLTYRNVKGLWIGFLHATGATRRPDEATAVPGPS